MPVTLKPRLVSPAAAWLATRVTPEPFSTWTLTLPGLVVRTWAPPVEEAAGVVATFGTVLSLAMAANTSPACGCMGWTRLAFPSHGSFRAS